MRPSRDPSPASAGAVPGSQPRPRAGGENGAGEARHFDLVVIGSGSGLTVVDKRMADWRIALVDKGVGPSAAFGGTCLNVGCIPTKMFVHTADTARAPEHGRALGVDLELRGVDWPAVRDRIFGRIDAWSDHAEEYRGHRQENLTLYRGEARFTGERRLAVSVGGEEFAVTADRIVVAPGSRPVIPDVPGLDAGAGVPAGVDFHTSDSIMRMERLPARLAVLGSGPIAAELAHVFSALGVEVTVIARGALLLGREDRAVAECFTELASGQWNVLLNRKLLAADRSGEGIRLTLEGPDGAEVLETDELLVAVGRRPNSDLVDAAAGGLAVHPDGRIVVDDRQATSVPGVWALGDVSSPWQLKHVANREARTVQHNLLDPGDSRTTDHRFVPHAVFSSPPVASVGMTEQELVDSARRYVRSVRQYSSIAYGWAMEDTTSFAKVLADPATGELLGAHIIGPEAPTLIQGLVQAMTFGQDVRAVAREQYWIHPALTEVVENALLDLRLD